MNRLINKWVMIKYPQNYVIKKPLQGGLIISVFCFAFINLYKPFGFHASRALSYEATMVLYSFICGTAVFIFAKILKAIGFFSSVQEWTLTKELLSILFVLAGLGITIYFMGFIIEPPVNRWNIPTFLSSCGYSFLLGILPFIFFTSINYRYLLPQQDDEYAPISNNDQTQENPIKINSQLKKEELNFFPSEFLFAESDGNYVVFYLNRDNVVKKEIIRNSINNIEQQLSDVPYFLRIHRAFIVNLKKVSSKHGNTLGYHINISGIDNKIPVSRNNTRNFNKLLEEYFK